MHDFYLGGQLEPALSALGLSALDEPGWAIDARGRITYVNAAWERAAESGQAAPARAVLGTLWQDHVQGPVLRAVWRDLLEAARNLTRRSAPLLVWGKSHTPERYRVTATRLWPLYEPGGDRAAGVALAVRIQLEAPLARHYCLRSPGPEHLDAQGQLRLCGGCRRAYCEREHAWQLVPDYLVRRPAEALDVLCETCLDQLTGVLHPARAA